MPLDHTSKRWGTLLGLASLLGAAPVFAACTSPSASRPPITSVAYRFGVVGNHGAISQLQLDRPIPIAGIRGRIVQIAASNSDGYALTSNGGVWAWGVASFGELGNGTRTAYSTRAVKVDFPTSVKITALANPMPFDGALAIDSRGHGWGWGLDADGDLCLSGLTELRPMELSLSGVTLATGARTHSLVDSEGKLYACGSGEYGVLGTGSMATALFRSRSLVFQNRCR